MNYLFLFIRILSIVFTTLILTLVFGGVCFKSALKVICFLFVVTCLVNIPIKIIKNAKYYILKLYSEQISTISDDRGGYLYEIKKYDLFGNLQKTEILSDKEYELYSKRQRISVSGKTLNLLLLSFIGILILIIFFILFIL